MMRNYFPKRPSGAPLHTFSKLYDVPVGFVNPPFLGCVLLYLRSPKGGCCSISDDLTCSWLQREGSRRRNREDSAVLNAINGYSVHYPHIH